MSEELSFFDDPTPASTGEAGGDVTPAAPESTPAAPAIDHGYVSQLEAQIQAQGKWQQDLSRFLSGQSGQPAAPNPQDQLMAMLQNPQGFEEQILTKAMQRVQEQSVWDNAIQAEETAHPHLVPFKNEIMSQANVDAAYQAFCQKNGRQPQPRELVTAARENFQTKLQGYQTAAQQQQTATEMQKHALNLSVGGDGASKGPLTVEQINTMSPDDFARLRSRVINGG